LLLVGDGPLGPSLEEQARQLGISDDVLMPGYFENALPFLHAMDVFVLAVPAGSMSIALLEAMSQGLPSVITFCGPEEAVIPEETGLCAPPSNPAGLAVSLARLVADECLRVRLGRAASAHVRRHFSIARVADDLMDVYQTRQRATVPPRLRADGLPNPRPGC
jgi:glycosyltransferase involved in cell wall biosynthesis